MEAKNLIFPTILIFHLFSCSTKPDSIRPIPVLTTTSIPSYMQRVGDINKGKDYLINGDYIKSGIPYDIWQILKGADSTNLLGRSGLNKQLPYDFNAVNGDFNTTIVTTNCLTCHAAKINNKFIVGLGNSDLNFSTDLSINIPFLDAIIQKKHSKGSFEYADFEKYKNSTEALFPLAITSTTGANPADKYALILANHRDKNNLKWNPNSTFLIGTDVIPTDVPAWWLLNKKNAMFYTGAGQGDFVKLMMASSLLTLTDTSNARVIDGHFVDVLAYIRSLKAPKYPFLIDNSKAEKGKITYINNCQSCHGSNNGDYPNLLVSLAVVGTDEELSNANYANSNLIDWYNSSWFSKGQYSAKLVLTQGYVAPPLDGVWATAPYLHNGSIPTLSDLLNSPQRPVYWKKKLNVENFDITNVGWQYEKMTNKIDNSVYDTNEKGYGNSGHIFGDILSLEERNNLIEYLKTL